MKAAMGRESRPVSRALLPSTRRPGSKRSVRSSRPPVGPSRPGSPSRALPPARGHSVSAPSSVAASPISRPGSRYARQRSGLRSRATPQRAGSSAAALGLLPPSPVTRPYTAGTVQSDASDDMFTSPAVLLRGAKHLTSPSGTTTSHRIGHGLFTASRASGVFGGLPKGKPAARSAEAGRRMLADRLDARGDVERVRLFRKGQAQHVDFNPDPYSGALNPRFKPKPKGIFNPFTESYMLPKPKEVPLPPPVKPKPQSEGSRRKLLIDYHSLGNSAAAHLFGKNARDKFFTRYKSMTLRHHDVVHPSDPSSAPLVLAVPPPADEVLDGLESDESDDGLSHPVEPGARAAFLGKCMQNNTLPEPIIVRKRWTPHLKLSHYGIGDRLGKPVADSLADLPHLEYLDLRDNRMSDDMVATTVKALIKRTSHLMAAEEADKERRTNVSPPKKRLGSEVGRQGRRRRSSVMHELRKGGGNPDMPLGHLDPDALASLLGSTLANTNDISSDDSDDTDGPSRDDSSASPTKMIPMDHSRPGSRSSARRSRPGSGAGPSVKFAAGSRGPPLAGSLSKSGSRLGSRRGSQKGKRARFATRAEPESGGDGFEDGLGQIHVFKPAPSEKRRRALARGLTVHDMASGVHMRAPTSSFRMQGLNPHKMHKAGGLHLLDLSENTVGVASAVALSKWIPLADKLQTIKLARCTLTDSHSVPILEALVNSPSLTSIDLSGNSIGVVGAEVLARLITKSSCLRTLDLSWNNIGGEGGYLVGTAVRHTNTLRTLNISWTGFSSRAAQALGQSLHKHGSIEELDVSHNSIGGASCLVIAEAVSTCAFLQRMNLDGNPIGRAGVRAIFRALHCRGMAFEKAAHAESIRSPLFVQPLRREVDVSMIGCNLQKEDISLFDPQEPGGAYRLDLAHPYDKFVLRMVLQQAEQRAGFSFVDMLYEDPFDGWKAPLHVKRIPVSKTIKDPWPPGVQYSEGRCQVQSDGLEWVIPSAGVLTMRVEFNPQPAIHSHAPSDAAYDNLIDVGVVCVHEQGGLLTHPDQMIQHRGFNDTARFHMVQVLSDDAFLTCSQAKGVLELGVVQQSGQVARVDQMARLLCRVVDHENVSGLIHKSLSSEGRRMLQKKLGSIFQLVVRNPTGHYIFDLGKPGDRVAALRLLEINAEERRARIKLCGPHGNGDTSQEGDWNNIRNIIHNGVQMTSEDGFTQKVPRSGVLELDYVSTKRPPPGATAVEDHELKHLCQRLKLLPRKVSNKKRRRHRATFDESVLKRVSKSNRAIRFLSRRGLLKKIFGDDTAAATVSAKAKDRMRLWKQRARNRMIKRKLARKAMLRTQSHYMGAFGMGEDETKEGVADDALKQAQEVELADELASKLQSVVGASHINEQAHKAKTMKSPSGAGGRRKLGRRLSHAGDGSDNEEEKEARRIVDITIDDLSDYSGSDTDDSDWEGFRNGPELAVLTSKQRLAETESERIRLNEALTSLNCVITGYWLKARQAACIVDLFPKNVPGCRVTAACSVFSRIVDLENFDFVSAVLTQAEQFQLAHRLGWLNILNPLKPERRFELDLSHRDHRVVCSILVRLAIVEPGENWTDESFDDIIGWKLPNTWATSVPHSGLVKMTYTSNDKGCQPDWAERLSLREIVLMGDASRR